MIGFIDNYDSFVYNLARYFAELGQVTEVFRNDAKTLREIRQRNYEAVVISPGPCGPKQAGISLEAIEQLSDEVPLLGVCLGHQCIAEAFGARVVPASEPMHGRTSPIHHHAQGLFAGMPNPFRATRYHSLIVSPERLPSCLEITAQTNEGLIMAIAHRRRPIYGVQFHPESVLTIEGHRLLHNFLRLAGVPTVMNQERLEPTTPCSTPSPPSKDLPILTW